MNKLFTYLFLITASFLFVFTALSIKANPARNVTSRDVAVMVNAVVSTNPPSITLTWAQNELANTYEIRKKRINETSWSNPLTYLGPTELSFKDVNVEIGVSYEYEVRAVSIGRVSAQTRNWDDTVKVSYKDTVVDATFYAFGYVNAGIELDQTGKFGKALLLVDSSMVESLQTEIAQLENDLISEGWAVETKQAPRAEEFNPVAVAQTKKIIRDVKNASNNLTTVFLIGRIAVPYSGDTNPDAHPDHLGAWPADVYYGSMNENEWSDAYINRNTASRQQNRNSPGDGKFDQNSISSVDLQIGRIDFYDMPIFAKSELDLLKGYFAKNHAYRTKQFEPAKTAFIDDHFGAFGNPEAFASCGWRNFGALLPYENVTAKDFISSVSSDSYMWLYGCGGGSWDTAAGVVSSKTLATIPVNSVFTILFGSYFGDWDCRNNLLRAILGTEPMALTCFWAARPHWYVHNMGMGMPIGFSAKVSQNNLYTYLPNTWYLPLYKNGVYYTVGFKGIHMALLGDPTLTMYPAGTPSPKTLSVSQITRKIMKLMWTVPDEPVKGYHVYRITDKAAPVKLTSAPINETFFNDSTDVLGDVSYMVQSVNLIQSQTGTFYTQSRGVIEQVTITGADNPNLVKFSVSTTPNPAINHSSISVVLAESGYSKVEIYNASGYLIKSLADGNFSAGGHTFGWNLIDNNGFRVPQGVYFLKVQSGKNTELAKIVVLK